MKRHYIVRVELHNLPKSADSRPIYDFLHDELTRRKFYKEIPNKNGAKYQLPDAVYLVWENVAGTLNGSDISKLVQASINATVVFVKQSYPSTNMYGSELVVQVAYDSTSLEVYWHNLTKL